MTIEHPGKKQIIDAGKTITDIGASADESLAAYKIANDWRVLHAVPLDLVELDLREKCSTVDSRAFTSARLKRMESIASKLCQRDRMPGIDLWSMQDLGGCRAILPTLEGVRRVAALYDAGRFEVKGKPKDYISEPKSSGYRGIHIIVKFKGAVPTGLDGMLIEVQLRSRQQHIFATAVETVGYFTEQSLKSSIGQERWLRFFSLMGSLFSLQESGPVVPETPATESELIAELSPRAEALIGELQAFADAVKHTEAFRSHQRSHYYVLIVDAVERSSEYHGFGQDEFDLASMLCIQAEDEGRNAVLVSTESLSTLWQAYPNYFLDLNAFMRVVREIVHER